MAASVAAKASRQVAAFGAGCFWGTQKYFKKEFGTKLTRSAVGYIGGKNKNPTYEQVCTGTTNHAEVLFVEYDANNLEYAELVRFFYRMHDPTTLNRQGNDRGTQYRSAIFYFTPEQKEVAEQVTKEIGEDNLKGQTIVTTFESANEKDFYEGEPYHQDYLDKNPGGYCNHKLRW